jgi:prepilin-type N-terminal cleavage/methylation domain-containing protein
MKIRKHQGKFIRDQRGFTLVELTVSLVLVGIIGAAAVVAMFQISSMNTRTQARVTLSNQLGFATNWITSDSQMAQVIDRTTRTTSDGTVILTLTWGDWENDGHKFKVEYVLDSSHQLKRKLTTSNKDDSSPQITSFPVIISNAQNSSVVKQGDSEYDASMLQFNLRASIPPIPEATAVVRVMIRSSVN